MKANKKLRSEMRLLAVPFWRLAKEWGCNETTAVKRFREELSEEDRAQVLAMIRKIARSMEVDDG